MTKLDDLIEEIVIGEVDDDVNDNNEGGLKAIIGWFYVEDLNTTIGYFPNEESASRFRLAEITRRFEVICRRHNR